VSVVVAMAYKLGVDDVKNLATNMPSLARRLHAICKNDFFRSIRGGDDLQKIPNDVGFV
jgi:hypothetical protein